MRRIVSFSRRTDSASFMPWFMDKIDKGGCFVPNPYSGKPYFVSLKQEEVYFLNFWTKNPAKIEPFILPLKKQGYKSAFFVSINNYPKYIEPNVPNSELSVSGAKKIVSISGEDSIWWRYDPIIITKNLDSKWHIDNFTKLCKKMQGLTKRVIVSLVQLDGWYSSIKFKVEKILQVNNDALVIPKYNDFIKFLRILTKIAAKYNISLEVCCYPKIREEDISDLKQAACLSMEYIRKIDTDIPNIKKKGTRKGSALYGYASCACVESKDIGVNGTCKNGCIYCYANRKGISSKIISVESPWLSPSILDIL